MPAYFIVRATVQDPAERNAFDRWYQDEHLPDALACFKARRAFRGWSQVDSNMHFAFYEFDTLAAAQAITGTEGLKALIAEFDRVWGNRVTRTREVVEIAQTLQG